MEKKKITIIMTLRIPATMEEAEEGVIISFDDIFDKLNKADKIIVDKYRWA